MIGPLLSWIDAVPWDLVALVIGGVVIAVLCGALVAVLCRRIEE